MLAATSRPDLIDPALLRPGRLDKALYCGLPDQAGRASIFRAILRKLTVADDVDLEEAGKKTDGYSGADLQGVVTTAQLNAVHEQLEALKVWRR